MSVGEHPARPQPRGTLVHRREQARSAAATAPTGTVAAKKASAFPPPKRANTTARMVRTTASTPAGTANSASGSRRRAPRPRPRRRNSQPPREPPQALGALARALGREGLIVGHDEEAPDGLAHVVLGLEVALGEDAGLERAIGGVNDPAQVHEAHDASLVLLGGDHHHRAVPAG